MDQEDNTQFQLKNIEGENIKEQTYQYQNTRYYKNMKIFMIKIMIINILQTSANGCLYFFIFKWNNFSLMYFWWAILGLLFYPMMIIIFRCFHKSTIFKNLLYFTFFLFFSSFVGFTFVFFDIFGAIHQDQDILVYFGLTIIDLLAGYLFNIIYFVCTNYLIERNFQIIQCISTILVTIVAIIILILQCVCDDSDSKLSCKNSNQPCEVSFQSIISILYFQAIMTLYQLIQVSLLFETLNGKFKLQPNQFIYGYMQIQTRTFLYCFKD